MTATKKGLIHKIHTHKSHHSIVHKNVLYQARTQNFSGGGGGGTLRLYIIYVLF
jgi:hypothetical protein